MTPTIGRTVIYVVSEEDAEKINRRRTDTQAHIGNRVEGGMEFPGVVVRAVWPVDATKDFPINLQVFLDGNDVYWATSVHEDGSKNSQLGHWHWPPRE